jgi:mRNA interferase ChpB
VVRRVVVERGDIVSVNLDPSKGHEQKGMRPALVLSTSVFNALGLVMVAPITQGGDFARHAGFATALGGSGTVTQGVALLNQVRMLDLEARAAKRLESAPEYVVEDALARLRAITD